MKSNLRIIFFTHPRSGSSSLYQILQLHPALHILEEPFNENYTHWNPHNKNYRELIHDIPSLDTQLVDIFTTYNGIKVLDYQLPDEFAATLWLQDNISSPNKPAPVSRFGIDCETNGPLEEMGYGQAIG